MLDDGNVEDDIDLRLVMEAVNKVLHRRQYFREKQRSHRRRKRDDIRRLRSQVDELEALAENLRAAAQAKRKCSTDRMCSLDDDGGLSWRTIAATFRQETRSTLAEYTELVEVLRRHRGLLTRMQMWVEQNDVVPVVPRSIIRWQQVTLSNDPVTRKLTKEWATQQMYHNTGAAFQAFPMSTGCDDFTTFDLSINDKWVNAVEFSQYIWDAPMELVVHMLRHHMQELSKIDPSSVSFEWTENTVVLQTTLPDGDAATAVVAHFHEAERCVVVMRHLQSDDAFRDEDGTPLRDSRSLVWFDLRRLGTGQTVARVANLTSIHLKPSGQGSIDAFAASMGLDLTNVADGEVPHVLRQYGLKKARESDIEMRSHILVVLERVRAKLTVGCGRQH
ncbi:hypothetical protein, variant [Aphanomyces invadans]|uniref:Uncharacterized protein n=1 Tax=Aphanomyces invadans TaxID=157072 RepID=A0A024TAQ7_9STRA|nr:hypothetical protein, variant [Aphanomyces invadans]ETV90701.1 hypothetical protein, variant [Aphanomyces invadans]|eukprot:XP_008880698.1 hypothetical protein, variant [Aphanomyces invadans]